MNTVRHYWLNHRGSPRRDTPNDFALCTPPKHASPTDTLRNRIRWGNWVHRHGVNLLIPELLSCRNAKGKRQPPLPAEVKYVTVCSYWAPSMSLNIGIYVRSPQSWFWSDHQPAHRYIVDPKPDNPNCRAILASYLEKFADPPKGDNPNYGAVAQKSMDSMTGAVFVRAFELMFYTGLTEGGRLVCLSHGALDQFPPATRTMMLPEVMQLRLGLKEIFQEHVAKQEAAIKKNGNA